MTMRKTTTALTSGLFASAAIAFLPGAATAVPDEDVLAAADLDGDGADEQITIRAAGTADQRIVTEVDGREVAADAPADTRSQVREPRVTDLDGNGAEELVLTELTGANTETFDVWAYVDGALRSLGAGNMEKLRLYEGGGVAARSGYTCENVAGGRQLVVLSAEVDDATAAEPTYSGDWTYYRLQDGTATPTGSAVTFTAVGARSALLSPDPGACTT
jgi:hypothetical protein